MVLYKNLTMQIFCYKLKLKKPNNINVWLLNLNVGSILLIFYFLNSKLFPRYTRRTISSLAKSSAEPDFITSPAYKR